MGQQQLFAYMLVILIVGVATIVAIDTMKESYENSNEDAVRQDILFSMQEAQQYYLTHEMMDGGGRSFDGLTIDRFTLGDSSDSGTYAVSGNGDTVTIEGWGNYEHIYIKAVGTMHSDGKLSIEWTYGVEEEE